MLRKIVRYVRKGIGFKKQRPYHWLCDFCKLLKLISVRFLTCALGVIINAPTSASCHEDQVRK
jgi:hypothetical protein